MKIYQALSIACAFGALWGGRLAAEGHMTLNAIERAERHLAGPQQDDPSMSIAATMLTLGFIANGREDPATLVAARHEAKLRLYGGAALAGLSLAVLLWLGVHHLRSGRHARS